MLTVFSVVSIQAEKTPLIDLPSAASIGLQLSVMYTSSNGRRRLMMNR